MFEMLIIETQIAPKSHTLQSLSELRRSLISHVFQTNPTTSFLIRIDLSTYSTPIPHRASSTSESSLYLSSPLSTPHFLPSIGSFFTSFILSSTFIKIYSSPPPCTSTGIATTGYCSLRISSSSTSVILPESNSEKS